MRVRYQDITAQFADPTTGIDAQPTTTRAYVYLVDQEAQGQLSEYVDVALDPRNAVTHPGLMTAAIDIENFPAGQYRVAITGLFGTSRVTQMQSFVIPSEDDNSKVV